MRAFLTTVLAGYSLLPVLRAMMNPEQFPLVVSKLAFAAGGACILFALLAVGKPALRRFAVGTMAAGLGLEILSSLTSLHTTLLPFGLLLAVSVLLLIGFIMYIYHQDEQ